MSDSFEYDVPPNQQILLQKQTEWAGLHALKEASDQLVERIEKLSQMSNVMADGAIGQVMRNWPHIFSVLSLNNQHRPDPNTTTEEEQAALPQLVRLAYTDESETTDKPSA